MSESHDPWEEARASQKADVQRIFEARPRSEAVRDRDFKLTKGRVAAVLGVVAALAIGAALVVPGQRDDAAKEAAAKAAEIARIRAAENAQITRDQRPVRATGPAQRAGESRIDWRVRQVAAGEAVVTADARHRVAAGTMDGPVAGVECSPFPATATRRALEADPSVPKGRYECFAYERKFALPELEGKARTGLVGVPFWLVIDYPSSGFVFCKITPRAGEGSFTKTGVVVPAPCRDPLA